MFYQIFLSPQVKQSVIIINKHGIHDLPHKSLNYLRLRMLCYAHSIFAARWAFVPAPEKNT